MFMLATTSFAAALGMSINDHRSPPRACRTTVSRADESGRHAEERASTSRSSISDKGFTIAASGAVLYQGFSFDKDGNLVATIRPHASCRQSRRRATPTSTTSCSTKKMMEIKALAGREDGDQAHPQRQRRTSPTRSSCRRSTHARGAQLVTHAGSRIEPRQAARSVRRLPRRRPLGGRELMVVSVRRRKIQRHPEQGSEEADLALSRKGRSRDRRAAHAVPQHHADDGHDDHPPRLPLLKQFSIQASAMAKAAVGGPARCPRRPVERKTARTRVSVEGHGHAERDPRRGRRGGVRAQPRGRPVGEARRLERLLHHAARRHADEARQPLEEDRRARRVRRVHQTTPPW